jgi:DNA gyrase/topoisomerase IV subunit B
MTEKFKILDSRSHVRLRVGMYLGSTSIEEVEQFLFGKWSKVHYTPAIVKMVNEILDNSIDEHIRTSGKFATKIDVSIDDSSVTISDNGRGIPQEEVHTPEGEIILRPVAAWTRVNAGTSFEAERTSIGANGVGSAATNFMSKSFVGTTWSNGNCLHVMCNNGAADIRTKTTKKAGNGTSVSFVPDFSLFECDSLADQDIADLIEDRLMGLQMAFPSVTFSFNGKKISVKSIKQYAELFVGEGASVIAEKSDNLTFFFTSSEDGFRSNSFINGVNTRLGGTYVDFVVNAVVDELLVMIKKKHKVEITKSVLKNGLTFVLFAREFVNPKYDSQTKERLTNSVAEVKKHFDGESIKDFKAIAKKIFAADDIIEPIIAAQLEKRNAEDRRNAIVAQKKLKKVKVAKHIAANKSEQGTLFLMEGLSALGFFLKVRNTDFAGAYPLRGVVMNTWDMKPADVLKNKELSELVAILGLDINNPNSVDDMTYKNIATLSDADVDGAKIATLLVAFFYKFWPRLLTEGRVGVTRSPIMISTNGKDEKWFFNYAEAKKFKETAKGYNHRYLKGLGSLTESEYDRVVNNPVLDVIHPDTPELFEMMFGASSEQRKLFMMADY